MHLFIYYNLQCKYLVTTSFCYFFVAVLFVFVIISFNLLYSFFGIKSTIKIVVVVVSLLWNLGCAEGIYDFYPQSFAS